jgi:sigma-B regulation protein RsbU (phosphoserine phosphatase)
VGKGKRYVLLVDDEAIILSVLSLHVKSFLPEGIELHTASSGESALEKLAPLLQDGGELLCVISDYMMSPMRGSELLGKLEILTPLSKKIMLTGQADLQAVSEVLNKARLFRYIEKPWEPKDLELTVLEAINMYDNETELARRTQELEILHKELEQKVIDRTAELNQKNEELRQGLQYARFVQECFLPNHTDAWDVLPRFHVFSTSAEAVSGDFYWYKNLGHSVLIAQGDCTGHGLAGALLTVLVSDLLSEKTSATHDNLNVRSIVSDTVFDLKKRLRRDVQYSDMVAGFDLALMHIDLNTGDTEWGSLNSNLMLVNENNEVEIVSKSKGFLHLDIEQTEIAGGKINIRGKRVVMCSDGLYDQIGEVTNKRLRMGGLIQWIESGQVFLENKCCIDDLFAAWKGTQDQTDDATWVSFQL